MAQKRVILYGNDLFQEVVCPNGKKLEITHWNLWITITLFEMFSGDWDELAKSIVNSTWGGSNKEGMLHHIQQLRRVYADNDFNALEYYNNLDKAFVKKTKPKVKKKIIEMGYMEKEKSAWMIKTPKKEKEYSALRGHWDAFQIDPEVFAIEVERSFPKKFCSESQSLKLSSKLQNKIEKLEKKKSTAELSSLYRACLTVILERIESADDSFGVIGDLYQDVFIKYIYLERSEVSMSVDDFYADIVELMIWEDYGFIDGLYGDFFSTVHGNEVSIVEKILKHQWDDLTSFDTMSYQADNALTLLGELYKSQLIYDKFPEIAALMGTRKWRRITSMAELAAENEKYDVAVSVYEACLSPGRHEDYLRKEYEKLKRVIQNK
ncbi:MAG: hypothetical protein Q3M24_06740 [Candidatus Electrothrix aestuarii]|uniref:DNA-binding transcriptional activator of the SARP family n=1 Tax=Candidatus Electrothrix aestuarii TaxID=3062594 RepID=A0AAU8LYY8_9BACT|nr:hypothetical protein [Candidatus Electrothrix aestuarii]